MRNKKFWNFVQCNSDEAELILNGPITSDEDWLYDTVTPKMFAEELKNLGNVSHITVRINSPGGDVFAANAIYTRLKDHKAKITVKIDGWVASAATIICCAADKVMIPSNAIYMIHNPTITLYGSYEKSEMDKITAALEAIKTSIINAYVMKTGKTAEKISELMDNETWLTGDEAVELGFADELMFETINYTLDDYKNYKISNVSMNIGKYNNLPKKIIEILNNKKEEKMMYEHECNPEKFMTGVAEIKTVSDLQEEYPVLVNKIIKDTIEKERNRIQQIENNTLKGYENLANEAKFINAISAADFAFKMLETEKKKGAEFISKQKKDIEASNVNRVGAVSVASGNDKRNIYLDAIDTAFPKK